MHKNKLFSICLIITSILVSGNSNFKISFEKFIKKYEWNHRILLLIAKNNNDKIAQETKKYFKTEICKNRDRNIKLIQIIGDEINKFSLPQKYQNKYGIWLIGYDGENKSYSKNSDLLKVMHAIIDEMPIRKEEMLVKKTQCK